MEIEVVTCPPQPNETRHRIGRQLGVGLTEPLDEGSVVVQDLVDLTQDTGLAPVVFDAAHIVAEALITAALKGSLAGSASLPEIHRGFFHAGKKQPEAAHSRMKFTTGNN
jgi:hypothetical protein